MRNAIICTSAMLAILFCWPILFGGAAAPAVAAQPSPSRPAAVTMAVPPAADPVRTMPANAVSTPRPVTVSMPVPATKPYSGAPETCTQRYARVAPSCTNESCQSRAIDALDICQGTGFWPN